MGNSRLGRLPARLRWLKVVALLDQSPEDTAAVAAATIHAAELRLDRARQRTDPSPTAIGCSLASPSASRSDDFAQGLEALGLHADSDTRALTFISRVFAPSPHPNGTTPRLGPFP